MTGSSTYDIGDIPVGQGPVDVTVGQGPLLMIWRLYRYDIG